MSEAPMKERLELLSATLRAFCIAEVASAIATHVFHDDRPVKQARVDLLAMALACKILYEPAMDVLWYTVHDFNRLLVCLPRHLRDTVPCDMCSQSLEPYRLRIKLRAPSGSDDWNRFEQYARRVRHLEFWSLGCIDPEVLRIFSERYSGDGKHPFLHLQKLQLIGSLEAARACKFLFTGPRVSECKLSLGAVPDKPADTQFLNNLTHLSSLSIQSHFSSTDVIPVDYLSPAFLHLSTLELGPVITAQSLHELSVLPRLRTLLVGLIIVNDFTFPAAASNKQSFPALECLSIESSDSESRTAALLSAFLRSITGVVRKLQIGSLTQSNISKPILFSLLSVLPSLHPGLRELRLFGGPFLEDNLIPSVDITMLSPLFACRKLTTLGLYRMGIEIEPADIKRLGAAWPQLETLELTPNRDHELYGYPILALTDLHEFAIHFPHLTGLAVPFDASEGISDNLPYIHSPTVTSLGIPFCPLPESKLQSTRGEIAAFISEVFPSAELDCSLLEERVGADLGEWDDEEDPVAWERELLKQWNAVSSLIMPFKLARERAVAFGMVDETMS